VKFAYPLLRPIFGAALAALAMFAVSALPSAPAQAQGGPPVSLIRDTEVERVLRTYLDPILLAANLHPDAVHLYIVNDQSINAFVAEGQNMFINTGLLMALDTPNEIAGVMAHETGHMADGHLVRTSQGIRAASVPLILSMVIGVAAIAAGAGDAGSAILMGGQQIAQRTFLAFSRTQESSADQAGIRYLNATHQSGLGMLRVFKRFENQEILSSQRQDPFAQTHPASSDRIAALQGLVDSSAYRDVKDSPESQFAFNMLRAKLRGYIERPDIALRRYPLSDNSKPARYARAMAYFHQPDMQKALTEMEGLLQDEPENPYFLEMYGQIKVEMGKVDEGIIPYQAAVKILPDAPLLRVALGAAMLGTERMQYTEQAAKELQTAIEQERDNAFAWYELAQAYARMGQTGRAELATAERYFALYAFPQAIQFAGRSQRQLPPGSTDWQRASDIIAIAQSQMAEQKNR
jgi:predicted Zn-dependent protease